MNQSEATISSSGDVIVDSELTLIDVLIIFAKNKKLIIGMPIIAAVIAGAIGLALPNIYRATTKLLPPQQSQSSAAALLSQLGGIAGAAAGSAGLKNPNDLYIGMLKSRTIADKVIEKFDLKKVYDTDSLEKARKKLDENTTITSSKDGFITIEVEDRNQKFVAPLTNGYVDELLKLTKVIAVTEASQRRMFFEQQLELSKNNLAAAEMALKGALDTGGVISVDSDSRAILETVGRLRAQISAKEIQLSSMRAFVTTNNPDFKRVQEELNSSRLELSKLENGRSGGVGAANSGGTEQPGLENIKILREIKYHQMLYELLAKQYEGARLDEAKDPSIIQVLDRAIEPERKFKPKVLILVAISATIALLLAIGLAFLDEMKTRLLRTPNSSFQWAQLRNLLWYK
jgi:tyrosine-protein kinase Etk/Wzc